jgi:hypothetical protein
MGALGALALLGSAPADAGPVFYSGTQWQTYDGQNFSFEFDPAAISDPNSAAILTISGRGDFGGSGEFYSFWIEGMFGHENIVPTITAHHGTHDKSFSDSYYIDEDLLALITADGEIEMLIDFTNKVAWDQPDEAYLTVGIHYSPIPEPAALALFGLGMAGLGFLRRRRSA